MIKNISLILIQIFPYFIYKMIYEQNCYDLNVKYFYNLIEISIKIFLINL